MDKVNTLVASVPTEQQVSWGQVLHDFQVVWGHEPMLDPGFIEREVSNLAAEKGLAFQWLCFWKVEVVGPSVVCAPVTGHYVAVYQIGISGVVGLVITSSDPR